MVNLEWCNCPGLHGTYLLVQLQKPFPTWHHRFWSRDVKRINTNGLLGAKLVCSRSQDNIGSSIGMKRLEIRGAFARQQLNQLQLAATAFVARILEVGQIWKILHEEKLDGEKYNQLVWTNTVDTI